jgi:hypothetical protein
MDTFGRTGTDGRLVASIEDATAAVGFKVPALASLGAPDVIMVVVSPLGNGARMLWNQSDLGAVLVIVGRPANLDPVTFADPAAVVQRTSDWHRALPEDDGTGGVATLPRHGIPVVVWGTRLSITLMTWTTNGYQVDIFADPGRPPFSLLPLADEVADTILLDPADPT